MQRPKHDYGSEHRLWCYWRDDRAKLDRAILSAIGVAGNALNWLYPDPSDDPDRKEYENLDFLLTSPENLSNDFWPRWKWPRTGKGISWDGLARLRNEPREWILIEAKANQPEFCSKPSGAGEKSLAKIQTVLGGVKTAFGVHRHFEWTATYYQYANRLAALHFLTDQGIHAHLVFLYFTGETLPDGRPCPRSETEWKELIRAAHLTLGLLTPGKPDKLSEHPLGARVHDIFLPATI